MNNYDSFVENWDVQCERKNYSDLRLIRLSKSPEILDLNGNINTNSGVMLLFNYLFFSSVHFLSITKTWEQ